MASPEYVQRVWMSQLEKNLNEITQIAENYVRSRQLNNISRDERMVEIFRKMENHYLRFAENSTFGGMLMKKNKQAYVKLLEVMKEGKIALEHIQTAFATGTKSEKVNGYVERTLRNIEELCRSMATKKMLIGMGGFIAISILHLASIELISTVATYLAVYPLGEAYLVLIKAKKVAQDIVDLLTLIGYAGLGYTLERDMRSLYDSLNFVRSLVK